MSEKRDRAGRTGQDRKSSGSSLGVLAKIISHILLLVMILSAIAVIVPPLTGVTTTIVDSGDMNTNLPLCSVTYSKGVSASTLKAGDKVLKTQGHSTYAYKLESDYESGDFAAKALYTRKAESEQIALRGNVQKITMTLPAVGYLVVAMQSMQGILSIILIIVEILIFRTMSELMC